MYKTFTLPLKSAIALATLFILTACGGGFTIDLNSTGYNNQCLANPFELECDNDAGIAEYRKLIINDCANNPEKANTPLCIDADATTNPHRVTAAVWADSFDEPLAHGATHDDTESQFLIGRRRDLDTGGRTILYGSSSRYDGNLNLANATFNGTSLGGDRADGLAFIKTLDASNFDSYAYVGILSNTNLGTPLAYTVGSAKWIGAWRGQDSLPVDFVLNILFGTGDGAGEIEALVQNGTDFTYDYELAGEFDDTGVITGTVRWGGFRVNDPDNRGYTQSTGKLTGLIGREGAVGAYLIEDMFGGFVARPPSAAELRALEQTCNDDPFHKHCNVGYESERNAVIEHCIIGDNANDESCDVALGLNSCLTNPFNTWCNDILPGYYRQAQTNRVVFCSTEGNADNPLCTDVPDRETFGVITPVTRPTPVAPSTPKPTITKRAIPQQITASVWANSFTTPLAHGATHADTQSKFLIGRETDLDTGGVDSKHLGNLNLADATFNGAPLGGDAEDGVAFFRGRTTLDTYTEHTYIGYSGILSGTNLGAPLTQRQGSAQWVGEFQIGYFNQDFVLHVSFGAGEGVGTLKAIIQKNNIYQHDFRIIGEFDDAGVITGSFYTGGKKAFADDEERTLTGLIGQEGAVGAFLDGGFVARPATQAELTIIAQTCADNPFNNVCPVKYESVRNAIIEQCITGDNANNEALCGNVMRYTPCVYNPFGTYCNQFFEPYYKQAQAHRANFCRDSNNADNVLCESKKVAIHICRLYPFDARCLGDINFTPDRTVICADNPFDNRCVGTEYNYLRTHFCAKATNAGNPACSSIPASVVSTVTPNRVTAADWVASFNGTLRSQPDANDSDTGNEAEFLEGNADDLNSGVLGDSRYYRHTSFGVIMFNLNLDTASFDGKYLNGDVEDGVAFFDGVPYEGRGIFKYAGILSGTDLGAPINRTGTATWHGSINETDWHYYNIDFSLDIEFNGAAGGTIKGFTQSPSHSYKHEIHHLLITGVFDSNGVITGISNKGFFTDGNPDLPIYGKYAGRRVIGVLKGLIGEEGAVGAFIAKDDGYIGYAGGFVVRPSEAFESPAPLVNNARVTAADWQESFDEGLLSVPNPVVPDPGVQGSIYPIVNKFLKGSKTGLSVQNRERAWYEVVTFADASLGGDAADGFALSKGNTGPHYAGILSGTDLGLPLTQTQGSAVWHGRMKVLSSNTRSVDRNFSLLISFGAGSQAGTITGYEDYNYKLDGEFDAAGVITGTSEYGSFNAGTLTGLIGQEGAIGVFISNNSGYGGYTGGFIVRPPSE